MYKQVENVTFKSNELKTSLELHTYKKFNTGTLISSEPYNKLRMYFRGFVSCITELTRAIWPAENSI